MLHRRCLPVALLAVVAFASPAFAGEAAAPAAPAPAYAPPVAWVAPFALLLLVIAVAPLIPKLAHLWHRNLNKLLAAIALAIPIVVFYAFVHPGRVVVHGGHATQLAPGAATLLYVLKHAVVGDYIPFMVLLFSLYTISGGIKLRGDLRARPIVNTAFLAVGALLASFIGTTGAAMLLIRPLLQTNSERRHVRHTFVFFIFIVCNLGGCLLPIGDPPLFLGYLRGVPFLWTLHLAGEWLVANAVLLAVYFVWDVIAFRRETPSDKIHDRLEAEPLSLGGAINLLYLLGVVAAVGLLVPGKPLAGTGFVVPNHLREAVMLSLAGLSLLTTAKEVRVANHFNFAAIAEVAALFIGIFVTMQTAIEILQARGPSLGLTRPWQYFWATGGLSSFLDNAPTYVVFFETANSLTHAPGPGIMRLLGGNFIRVDLLEAVSLGAVFMGANTYIGNGPNFMVKAICEERGVRMPSFLGYMAYSTLILIPIFVLLTFVFFVFNWI